MHSPVNRMSRAQVDALREQHVDAFMRGDQEAYVATAVELRRFIKESGLIAIEPRGASVRGCGVRSALFQHMVKTARTRLSVGGIAIKCPCLRFRRTADDTCDRRIERMHACAAPCALAHEVKARLARSVDFDEMRVHRE